jgi:CheY-like chemotaxis protein
MGHSVLIIDDDPTTRYVLSRVLERDGYTTRTADNGAQGVRRLVEARPCVIVLDDEMPVMDGHDFREVQKRIAPEIPIVCMTADADPQQVARRVGAARLQPKPLNLPDLCETVRELCGGAHGRCTAPEAAAAQVAGRSATAATVMSPARS